MSSAGNVKNTYKREKSVPFFKGDDKYHLLCSTQGAILQGEYDGNLPSGIFGDSDHKNFENGSLQLLRFEFH